MAESNVPALELRGIEKHYGFVKALDAVDFARARRRSSGAGR